MSLLSFVVSVLLVVLSCSPLLCFVALLSSFRAGPVAPSLALRACCQLCGVALRACCRVAWPACCVGFLPRWSLPLLVASSLQLRPLLLPDISCSLVLRPSLPLSPLPLPGQQQTYLNPSVRAALTACS